MKHALDALRDALPVVATLRAEGAAHIPTGVGIKALARQVASLGALQVGSVEGGTKVRWSPYGGASACFTYYKVVYSLENPKPSYLGGDPAVAVSGQESDRVVLTELEPGKTYYLRVQVIRSTHMGSFVVAQSKVTQHTVP